jgi:hypothetical protein
LSGVIRQGKKVVGAIVIPEASDVFIREFNHCYGQLRMSVAPSDPTPSSPASHPHTFRLPDWFRHVWHASQPVIDPNSLDPGLSPSEPLATSSLGSIVPPSEVRSVADTPEHRSKNQQPRRRRPRS